MKPRARTRGLFWTFAGTFLLVLVAATLLQIVVTVAVLHPLATSAARERAESTLGLTVSDLETLPDPSDDREIMRALHEHRFRDASGLLVFMGRDGRLLADRPLPPEMRRETRDLAAAAAIDGATKRPPERPNLERAAPEDPLGLGPPPPGGRPPRDGAPPNSGGSPPEGGPPPDGGLPRGEGPPFQPRDRKLVLLAHRSWIHDGAAVGSVLAVGAEEPRGLWRSPESRTLLLFVPFGMLAAAAAALLMVRVLVKRLRALETVAARVAEGDLSARIETSGADEIGGLEERFNRMTERLAAARDAVDETDRQRRRLLADITHELATPLTSIRGYVETLLDPGVPVTVEERTGYLRDVLEEAQRLDLLSSDLLDLARLEAGAQPLKRVRLDWSALCQNAARRFEPRFREAGLRLEWIGTPPEAWVMADGRRMEQVIENLLVNALRYVPRGGTVRLGLDRVASAGGDRFRLAVSDDGPGIADQDLPHVFERFYRASHAREGTGSGLGLAIVREIVVRHGGEARAEHHAPRGARFVVELPVEA